MRCASVRIGVIEVALPGAAGVETRQRRFGEQLLWHVVEQRPQHAARRRARRRGRRASRRRAATGPVGWRPGASRRGRASRTTSRRRRGARPPGSGSVNGRRRSADAVVRRTTRSRAGGAVMVGRRPDVEIVVDRRARRLLVSFPRSSSIGRRHVGRRDGELCDVVKKFVCWCSIGKFDLLVERVHR